MADDVVQPPKLQKHGGVRRKGERGATAPRGSTSVDYILRRLEREGYTDLIEAIHARRVSAFATAVALGWARRPQTLHGENSNQAKRRRYAFIDVKSLIG